MGIRQYGANRMIGRSAGGRRSLERPERGLGPVGMPGSAGYTGGGIAPDERTQLGGQVRLQRAALPAGYGAATGMSGGQRLRAVGLAPTPAASGGNAYERMGLYWTGDRVAQGRPLREIESGIATEEKRTALAERGQAAQEQDADRRFGLAGRAQGAQERDADRRFGLAERGQTAEEADADRRFGLAERGQSAQQSDAERRFGLAERGQTAAEKAAAEEAEMRRRTLGMNSAETLAGLAPDSQPGARRLMGVPDEVGIMQRPSAAVKDVAPTIRGNLAPEVVGAVEEAQALDPDAEDYEATLGKIGKSYGLGDDAARMRRLVAMHGASIEEDRRRRLAGTAAGARMDEERRVKAEVARRQAAVRGPS